MNRGIRLFSLAVFSLTLQVTTPRVSCAGESSPARVENRQTFTGKVLVHIEGLACPFCAYGVEKHLKKIPDVKKARVNLGEGTAVLSIEPAGQVTTKQIKKAVRKAGFKASEIISIEDTQSTGKSVALTGQVEKNDGEFFLILKDGTRYFLYDVNPLEGGGESLSPSLLQRLKAYSEDKTRIEIEGLIHEHKGPPHGLWVNKLKVKP